MKKISCLISRFATGEPTRPSSLVPHSSTGFSHVEIMITIAVIGILITGVIGAFSAITKGLITSKTRTISTNLTQEKVEYLKNISYARLLVTKQTDLDNPAGSWDRSYYPPETLYVGDSEFKRYTTVWKATDDGTSIVTISPTAPDEGIKKIKIEVKWKEGQDDKSLILYNFKEDTTRTSKPDSISGLVITTGTPVGIASARVEILQNINWNTTTSATGYYIIKTTGPITVQARATKDGYWPNALGDFITTVVEKNIILTPQEQGNASGFVYKRDHLVISEVCVALTEDATEYIELYNPTTYQISITDYHPYYVKQDNTIDDVALWPGLTLVNSNISSHGYYLFASQQAVNGVIADCYWNGDKMPVANNKGGVGLVTAAYGVWVDSIAWGANGNSPPDNAKETTGLTIGAAFGTDTSIERISYSTHTAAEMDNPDKNGNAYDTDVNSADWVHHTNPNPQNTSNSETPVQGTPVGLAVVSANDGLSSTVSADSTGYYYLTGIATGTVTLYGSSLTLSGVEPNTEITTDGNTNCDIILSSTSEGGFISGKVVNGLTLIGVSGIRVSAGGAPPTTTDVNGNYSFSVTVGSYSVIANPDWDSASWTSGTSDSEATTIPVEVNENETVPVTDLKIYPAGQISGTTYNASDDPLPYVTVRTTSTNSLFSTDVVSDGDGKYTIQGVRVADDHNVYPVLDEAESFSIWDGAAWVPSTVGYTVDLSQGDAESGKDFKIGSVWGVITGTVTQNGNAITTGVLIVATTAAVPADAPDRIEGGVVGGDESTIYYGAISISDGTYSINVRKPGNYNMKAWHTTVGGDGEGTITTTPMIPGEGNGFPVNDANSTQTRTFEWP